MQSLRFEELRASKGLLICITTIHCSIEDMLYERQVVPFFLKTRPLGPSFIQKNTCLIVDIVVLFSTVCLLSFTYKMLLLIKIQGATLDHACLSSDHPECNKKHQAKMQSCRIVDTCLLLSSEE